MKQKYRKSVFIVTYRLNEDKIEYLILKRYKHWKGFEFPKGGVDKGETLIQTVKREIHEETGNKALRIFKYKEKGQYKYNKYFEDRPGKLGQTYSLFSAELKFDSKIKIDKREHTNFTWLSFEKSIKKLTWPNQRKCLKIVNADLIKRLK